MTAMTTMMMIVSEVFARHERLDSNRQCRQWKWSLCRVSGRYDVITGAPRRYSLDELILLETTLRRRTRRRSVGIDSGRRR